VRCLPLDSVEAAVGDDSGNYRRRSGAKSAAPVVDVAAGRCIVASAPFLGAVGSFVCASAAVGLQSGRATTHGSTDVRTGALEATLTAA